MNTMLRLAVAVHSAVTSSVSGWPLPVLAALLVVLFDSPGLASNQPPGSTTSQEAAAAAAEATGEVTSGQLVTAEDAPADNGTLEEGLGAQVGSRETQLVSTSDQDYAAVFRRLFSGACAESSSLPALISAEISAYVGSLPPNEAAEIFDRAGLSYEEALAAEYLARQQRSNESGIWSGTYEDSALRNAFRTVTAPFLAPSLMQMRRVAYAYSLEDFLGERDNETENLRDMILRGQVAIARYDEQDQTYRLVLPEDEFWRSGVSRCVECHRSPDSVPNYNSVRLIAPWTRLLGATTDGRVMAWDASQPLGGAVLDGYCGVVNTAPWVDLVDVLGTLGTLPDTGTPADAR